MEEKGVYKLTVKGDLFNKKYNYVIHQGVTTKEIRDPYGKGTSLNSKYSAVIDLNALNIIKKEKPSTAINSPTEAVIYEMDIRDFVYVERYNLVIFGDVLEHMPLKDAQKCVKKAKEKAQSEHDRILSDAQTEIAEIVNEATEKIVLDSKLDTYDQFLNAAKKEGNDE